MATKTNAKYNDQSIKALKGADRVRKRPAVIFGSDGLEGCEHSFFEILSNSVDEAKEGHGNEIKVTVFNDRSIRVDDHGRGVPLGYNEAEGRWNWDLIYCELYAGGKYDNNNGDSAYEFSLGLNGLGACATQYSSEFMDVFSYDGTNEYKISFKKGEPVTELLTRPLDKKERRTGTVIHWRPDIEVFTDINIPIEFFVETMRRQSVVNAGIGFVLEHQDNEGKFSEQRFYYENGISDYISELTGGTSITPPVLWHLETQGRDRADKDEYKLKADFSFCVSNTVNLTEYYHNSSFLEYGGSPDKAVKLAFVSALDKYIKGLLINAPSVLLSPQNADAFDFYCFDFERLRHLLTSSGNTEIGERQTARYLASFVQNVQGARIFLDGTERVSKAALSYLLKNARVHSICKSHDRGEFLT